MNGFTRVSVLVTISCMISAVATGAPPKPRIVDFGNTYGVAVSHDGNWLFGSLDGVQGGIAVSHLEGKGYELKRVIPLNGGSYIMLTHDEKSLIVTGSKGVAILDVGKMLHGDDDAVVADFSDGGKGATYVNVTKDDKWLFVSDEKSATISVINLERVRAAGFDNQAIVGQIPTGWGPIALTFSPDQRWLYSTSEVAPPEWGWPKTVTPEGNLPPVEGKVPTGAILVIDVIKATTDPSHAVAAKVPAGSSPVRMTLSSDGHFIYVTARGSHSVLKFDTAKLLSDREHACVASATVGLSPVPVALFPDDKTLIVGNTNRFGADAFKDQTLSVLDAERMTVIGTIEAGSFPRNMCVSADGQTLFVTNYSSNAIQIIRKVNLPVR